MNDDLRPNQWYWLRSPDGNLTPYRYHRRSDDRRQAMGEFFVGSFLRRFPLSAVVGEAHMPIQVSKIQ